MTIEIGSPVTKGSFAIPVTGEYYTFMFNPNQIRGQKGSPWVTQGIPGCSHPQVQHVGGGDRLISFDLYLDGDRGTFQTSRRRPRSRRPTQADSATADQADRKDITDDINFLLSLMIAEGASGITKAPPPTVIFSFGTLFKGVIVTVDQVNPDVTYWSQDLRPIRSTVGIVLRETVQRSVSRSEVFNSEAARSRWMR